MLSEVVGDASERRPAPLAPVLAAAAAAREAALLQDGSRLPRHVTQDEWLALLLIGLKVTFELDSIEVNITNR